MTTSLRKACRACSKAKRRCVPQLPACGRCAKKNIQCLYDLEPVMQAVVTTAPASQNTYETDSTADNRAAQRATLPQLVYSSVPAARDASAAAIGSGELPSSAAARPMLMTDGEVVTWIISHLVNITQQSIEGKPSPFVHTSLIEGQRIMPRQDSASKSLTKDLASNSHSQTLADSLAKVHQLLTQALRRLVLDNASSRKNADVECIVDRMFKVTYDLWSAPPKLLDQHSPWQRWCIAESIRRAMFAAVYLRGLWMATVNGYIEYEPFFESIPFDPRAGLWEASSEQGWAGLVDKYGGDHTKLKSYHEFVTVGGPELDSGEDGLFQRLLFVSYYGPRGIQSLRELDQEYASASKSKWW